VSDNRSTKVLIGVVFLVAAGLLAINNLVQSVPAGDWWLAVVLAAIGIGFFIWSQTEEVVQPKTGQTIPKTKLPSEPVSLKDQRSEIMEAPPAKIMEPPPKEVVKAEEPEKAVVAPAPKPEPEPAKPEPAKAEPAPEPEPVKAEPAPKPAPAKAAPAAEPDDLTRVEGIGPKYRDALVAAGISTFAVLAEKSQADLEGIVKTAGMRKPASIVSWAEQAKLAAKGDWAALEKLQGELTGGRKA
jgi:predicted flap endonuclease-1-like 5' DNA nuclease